MDWLDEVKQQLTEKKHELDERLERIRQNHLRSLDADSAERAVQMENFEVVDALGKEASEELRKIEAALRRLESGEYEICSDCGSEIGRQRLAAHPYARRCIDCAQLKEENEPA